MAPLLGVIPVRAGSKRIPRKAMQLVAGKPLLQWTIDIARASSVIDRLVVSTESSELAAYARLRGVEVIDRPAELADDDATIAEVVRHAVEATGWAYDVAVLQPTCPLLKPNTVDRVVGEWRHLGLDWGITVTDEPHLFWQYGRPMTPRVNGQRLGSDRIQRETGAVQLFGPDAARGLPGMRGTFPIDPDEALDIDTHADLAAAKQAKGRKRIAFHVVASDEKGSGHLRRCLQLSDALSHHDVVWAMTPSLEQWAQQMVRDAGHRLWFVDELDPDLVVLDCLDGADYWLRRYGPDVPTVVFEPDDARFPAQFARAVFDEFTQPEFAILRPEFLCLPPYEVRERADRVLVTFGGTDPTGMNQRVSRVVGHGADAMADTMDPKDGRSMAEAMRWADLVITSQGRTVHEAAAVGVPCLSIAVNERESRHAKLDGVVYLGLAHTLSDAAILDTVNRLLLSPALRAEMSRTASKQIDGRGLERVVFEIERLLRGI